MYEVDTFVRYGANGVFRIKEIITKKISARERKKYYVLEGMFGVETRITTPVDNPGLRMIITEEAIKGLIKKMPDLKTEWIEDRRTRSESFKAMIASNDLEQLTQVIKTIYLKKEEKEREKKMLSDEDLAIFNQAEEILCEEISLSSGMEKDAVMQYIIDQVEE